MMHAAKWALAACLACSAALATAGGLEQLQAFLSQTKSGDYAFEQTVTGPSSKSAKPLIQTGRLRFLRPMRFRFDYVTPYAQTIVADGSKLWLYDPDLAQVTVKNQAAVLAESPAGLLASATDVKELERHFTLSELPASGGMEWLLAIPKNSQAVLTELKVGLKAGRLGALELLDAIGQRSRLNFSVTANDQAPARGVFQFTPPQGTDVLAQ